MPRNLAATRAALALGIAFALAGLAPAPAHALSARKVFSAAGTVPNEFFGIASASTDFNGDGYRDFIAGGFMGFGNGGGRVAIYLGPNYTAGPLVMSGATDENLGYSVGAGDFNGDGFGDFYVGSSPGSPNPGHVYVLYGSSSPNAVSDLTLTGEVAGGAFGSAVAGAGDVNADGYGDIVVGAQLVGLDFSFAGRAYIYFGGASPNNVVDVNIHGTTTNEFLGASVACAGDNNGDGIDDVIVGGSHWGNTSGPGKAYVYFGARFFMDGFEDRLFVGGTDHQFGNSVAGIGDMNGDGFDDIAVGAPLYGYPQQLGRAYVFLGGPLADDLPDLTVTGANSGDEFGLTVAAAGDINNDGYADLGVGCYAVNNKGAALFMLGGDFLSPTPALVIGAGPINQGMGSSICGMGDVDGDGNDDVLIGAKDDASLTGTSVGAVFLYQVFPYQLLSPNGGEKWVAGKPATVRWRGHDVADLAISSDGGASWSTIAGSVGGADSNTTVVIAPDAVSANCRVRLSYRGAGANSSNSDVSDGVFSIVAPPAPVASRLKFTPTGAAASDNLGSVVAGTGDVNADGYADVIVGANANDAGGSNAGRAYVYFGGPGADAVADLTFTGAAANDNLGSSVASAGDFNGDGFDDVIVSAPNANGTGRAYVYFGGPAADGIADVTMNGEAASDAFGISVAPAGDVNGDGFADVIVGANRNDAGGVDAGIAYVFFGGIAPNGVADWVMSGTAAGDFFGFSVAGAGDVNRDGFADVIVGAFKNDAGGADAGRAYVFFGGSAPNSSVDIFLTGAAAGDNFGYVVSGAGDLNADGFDDFMAGAYLNDVGGSNAGRAYVYYGGPNPDGVADWLLTSTVAGEGFGFSLAPAGDVNADGIDDLIVCALLSDAGGTDAGRAYVFLGGPSPDGVADITLTGAAPSDVFGWVVAGVGDVSGDGFDDVAVGALQNDAGGSNAGRAYVYDCNRYFVTAPNGGETWNVGATKTVSWLGAEPADVWVSTDGGGTYERVESNVGGAASNAVAVRVPHLPSRFARVRVAPHDANVAGNDASDSLFTIQTSVLLLALTAQPDPDGGTMVSWSSDPGVGPDGLAGYRLYRLAPDQSGSGTRVGPDLIAETRYRDAGGIAGSSYRLTAVNGLAEELELGRTGVAASMAGLRVWPSPLGADAELHVEMPVPFAAPGFPATDLDVGLFDLAGRRVATLARGFQAGASGVIAARWKPGSSAAGRGAGVYFVRASAPSVGFRAERKVVVVP